MRQISYSWKTMHFQEVLVVTLQTCEIQDLVQRCIIEDQVSQHVDCLQLESNIYFISNMISQTIALKGVPLYILLMLHELVYEYRGQVHVQVSNLTYLNLNLRLYLDQRFGNRKGNGQVRRPNHSEALNHLPFPFPFPSTNPESKHNIRILGFVSKNCIWVREYINVFCIIYNITFR